MQVWRELAVATTPMSIPHADEVDAYLCRHGLEAVVDEAVNDAVLKQVAVSGAPQSQMTLARGAVPAAVRVSMCACVCAGSVRAHRDDANEIQRQAAAA